MTSLDLSLNLQKVFYLEPPRNPPILTHLFIQMHVLSAEPMLNIEDSFPIQCQDYSMLGGKFSKFHFFL